MKIKGGGRKRSASGSTEVVGGSIQEAMDGGEVHEGDLDYANVNSGNNPISGASSAAAAPSTSHLPETHQEQNLEEPEDDGEGDEEDEQDGDEANFAAPSSERTNLDEGFYEIEAIRRKRVRKGQLQYLIKWRGWPEAANTWEPLENLHTCSDFIEAFEQSLMTGKQRKRKRKHGVVHNQPKKRQQRANFSTYNVTDVEISVVDQRLPSAPINMSSLTHPYAHSQSLVCNREGEKNGDVTAAERAKQTDTDNQGRNASLRFDRKKDEHEYDPKLSELKATVLTNIAISDKLAINFQEARTTENISLAAGLSKSGFVEPVTENRCTGAKRRKSGSVKRFRQESTLSELPMAQNAELTLAVVESAVRVEPIGVENSGYHGESLSRNNKSDEARDEQSIIKIIKPLGYSASVSNNIQDVLVTFVAMRSDGTEVMVDNKFLKANNPLLLINFYEQNLRYTTRS